MSHHAHRHRRRVIVSTDAKNEADDQFAIVHALLTPSFDVEGVLAAHFGSERHPESLLASRQEVDHLIELLGATGRVEVRNGAESALRDQEAAMESEGSDFIIQSALREDPRPLNVLCLGPLTDVASALLAEPRVAQAGLRVIWIGGGEWPDGGWEYNLSNDIAAANVVYSSGVEIYQIPRPVFNWMTVGYAELETRISELGQIGQYLFDEVIRFNDGFYSVPIEHRPLADSAAVGVAMYPDCGKWRLEPTPGFGPDMKYENLGFGGSVRVYETVDARYILEDFIAKLRRFSRDGLLPF